MNQATIYFIGLALFSTAVPREEGALRVLLPQIEEHRSTRHRSMTSSGGIADRTIESHISAVIVKETDLLQEIGWETEPVPGHILLPGTTTAYRMVRLEGERLTFLPSAENGPLNLTQLVLPKPACATRIAQRTEVTAIVNVPAGTVSSCRTVADGRYDTAIRLQNGVVMTLWAEADDAHGSHAKALVVRGNATVYVLNVPASIFTTLESPLTTTHYLAYYDLLRTRQQSCARRLVAPLQWVSACNPVPFATRQQATGQQETAPIMRMVGDPDCTNTAWP